jgi:uncharacterized protein DUF1801
VSRARRTPPASEARSEAKPSEGRRRAAARAPYPARTRFERPEVAATFAWYPPAIRRQLLRLRELIFATAAKTPGVGPLEESLRWGEPAYLTTESKSGSTIRLDWKPKSPEQYALYFHCRSGLVDAFRRRFPGVFACEGKRALVFGADETLPAHELRACIALALTHHRRKRS